MTRHFRVTESGVNGPDGEIRVGTIIPVKLKKGQPVPDALVNKVEETDEGGVPVAVINPAEGGGPVGSAAERQAILRELTMKLGDEDFAKGGEPKVDSLNEVLEEGEPFTAEERDALWPGIRDEVMTARAAG